MMGSFGRLSGLPRRLADDAAFRLRWRRGLQLPEEELCLRRSSFRAPGGAGLGVAVGGGDSGVVGSGEDVDGAGGGGHGGDPGGGGSWAPPRSAGGVSSVCVPTLMDGGRRGGGGGVPVGSGGVKGSGMAPLAWGSRPSQRPIRRSASPSAAFSTATSASTARKRRSSAGGPGSGGGGAAVSGGAQPHTAPHRPTASIGGRSPLTPILPRGERPL